VVSIDINADCITPEEKSASLKRPQALARRTRQRLGTQFPLTSFARFLRRKPRLGEYRLEHHDLHKKSKIKHFSL